MVLEPGLEHVEALGGSGARFRTRGSSSRVHWFTPPLKAGPTSSCQPSAAQAALRTAPSLME